MARVRTKGVNPHGWEEKSRQEKAGDQEKEEITSRSASSDKKSGTHRHRCVPLLCCAKAGTYATASAE
jgi:hypothetical protein